MSSNNGFNLRFIYSISLVSALGGLLFGYDWVVIGGAKPFYEPFFGITDNKTLQGWAMSSALLGCLIGALVSGFFSDRYGRKKLLIIAAFLFSISAIGTGATSIFNYFIVYRIIGGIGIGLASNLSPMYIAEVTPGSIRGKLVSINQLTIVIGILLAQITNWIIAEPVPENYMPGDILNSWNGQNGWRIMFWAELVPAILFFSLMWIVPESPRWLSKKKEKKQKAFVILRKIGGDHFAKEEMQAIEKTLEHKHTKVVFQASLVKLLIIGIIIAAFQQWCGINVIFNYAQEVFTAAGYGVSDILFNIVVTGTVNLIFTFVAISMVDRWGRKKLMLLGAGGLAVVYAIMGSLYFYQVKGWPLLVLVVFAIATYAMSLAPVTWVLLSEIFPNRFRGVAMSVSTVSLWAACFALTYTFPGLNASLGASGTFWLYGCICMAGFIFFLRILPETKGKSLEQIENELM